MNILQLSAHFSPNIGGVETHLDDLVTGLIKKKYRVTVLTYQPLSTQVSVPIITRTSRLEVVRLPWIKGWFYKLVDSPFLEFLYLIPGLFIVLPFLLTQKKFQIIHAHGLVAATAATFWGRIFNVKVVVSTHSLYHFPKFGLYRGFVRMVLSQAVTCLCLSQKSVEELIELGIYRQKIRKFTYWIDLEQFRPLKDKTLKSQIHLVNQFVVFFVGRLVEEKGIRLLIKAIKQIPGRVTLVVAGDGPLRDNIITEVQSSNRIRFLGKLNSEELNFYYNLSDLLVVPSIHDEGFGRVILESLASGLPVLGSDRGSIPEALDLTAGRLVKVTAKNLQNEITYLKTHPNVLKKLKQNCRKIAIKRYSGKNLQAIINAYE